MKKNIVIFVSIFIVVIMGFSVAYFVKSITYNAIDEKKAIEIAKTQFEEYLQHTPDMKVKDPIYTATKIQSFGDEYWSVTVMLREPQYSHDYYAFRISTDGEKVTMTTG